MQNLIDKLVEVHSSVKDSDFSSIQKVIEFKAAILRAVEIARKEVKK